MKRPSFALTLLLASLAGSLLTVNSARCQSECPYVRAQNEVCPLLDDLCNDYLYYSEAELAQDDEAARFDPETGTYAGHDEVKPILDEQSAEPVATTEEALEAEYLQEMDVYDEAVDFYLEDTAEESQAAAAAPEEEAYEEYYEDYGYDGYGYDDYGYEAEEYAADDDYEYDYESDAYGYEDEYGYEGDEYGYEGDEYWYDSNVAEPAEVTTTETEEASEAESDVADYGYDEFDNYDYEYETYDYEPYDYEAALAEEALGTDSVPVAESARVEEGEELVADETVVTEAEEMAIPQPPAIEGVTETAEETADDVATAEDLDQFTYDDYSYDDWEGYEAYEYDDEAYRYDYEAHEYEYEVFEDGAVATPVEDTVDHEAISDEERELTSEYEAEFADTWSDAEVEPLQTPRATTPNLARSLSREALLGMADALDTLGRWLQRASRGLERTATLESDWR